MSIGIKKEKGIHRKIKEIIQNDSNKHEIPLCGYIVDAISEDGTLNEVQTRNFYSIKGKLSHFLLEGYTVNLIYPVHNSKKIQWIHPDGSMLDLRKSPKKGDPLLLLSELYGLSDEIVQHKNFRTTIFEIDAIEYKIQDGFGKNNRNRATKLDNSLEKVNKITYFRNWKEYSSLVGSLPLSEFNVQEFSTFTHLKGQDCQKILKFLHRMELISRTKEGKQYIYTKLEENSPPAQESEGEKWMKL